MVFLKLATLYTASSSNTVGVSVARATHSLGYTLRKTHIVQFTIGSMCLYPSLRYTLLLLVFDLLKKKIHKMVVSSLLSLMKDQVKLITENSLSAINPGIQKQ